MRKSTTVVEYFSKLPDETKLKLEELRNMIHKLYPDITEIISYSIPAYKLNGKFLIYIAGYKNHVSIYPVPRNFPEFSAELSNYKGGKGTVQFHLDKPLPVDLITRIIHFRGQNIIENERACNT